jgi:hypothetical protein
MTKTDLRELARNELEVKGRELEATVQVLIQGCVEEKQIAPTLERTAPTLGKG